MNVVQSMGLQSDWLLPAVLSLTRRIPITLSRMNIIDRFVPSADVQEKHEVIVRAEPSVVFETACSLDLESSALVRAIFRLREFVMRSAPADRTLPKGLVEQTAALGWGKLCEEPGRALVMGAVTRPWESDVAFRAVQPDRFALFSDPNLVKIVWTLEVEPVSDGVTRLRTQTRAVATDETARKKFHRYWRWARFGIVPIRWLMLAAVRHKAEHRTAGVI
jgi:hypothetical protein